MKTKHASPISREMEQIDREMLACIYEALLASGHIDPKGKTEEQIMAEVRESAMRWTKRRPMMMSTDFRQSLLTRARSLKRSRQDHDAILYYATHGKRIPHRHIKAVLQVCELRNEFVHYKYKMVDVDKGDDDKNRLKEAQKMAEKAIRYLQKFEEQHFFNGPARGLLKKLRNTKSEKTK